VNDRAPVNFVPARPKGMKPNGSVPIHADDVKLVDHREDQREEPEQKKGADYSRLSDLDVIDHVTLLLAARPRAKRLRILKIVARSLA
jgi:hypothetical protein